MNTTLRSRGAAILVYLAILAATGLISWVAGPRILASVKLHRAEKQVVQTATAAEKADTQQTTQQVAAGRGIQREATQAGIVLARIPQSPETVFIGARLSNIGAFSAQLFGPAPDADVAYWKNLAETAFSTNQAQRAEANRIIEQQQSQVSDLISKLADAQKTKEQAVAAAGRARAALTEAQAEVDHANGLLAWAKMAGVSIVVLWLIAAVIGILAKSNPVFAAASSAIHAFVAPGLQIAASAARKSADELKQGIGTLLGRIRSEMPAADVQRIRAIGDEVFDAAHKDVIGPIADEVHKAALLARSEAEKLTAKI